MHEITFLISFVWKCLVCGKKEPMKTEDGNEEWAMCCNKAMKMQPTKKLVVTETKNES